MGIWRAIAVFALATALIASVACAEGILLRQHPQHTLSPSLSMFNLKVHKNGLNKTQQI